MLFRYFLYPGCQYHRALLSGGNLDGSSFFSSLASGPHRMHISHAGAGAPGHHGRGVHGPEQHHDQPGLRGGAGARVQLVRWTAISFPLSARALLIPLPRQQPPAHEMHALLVRFLTSVCAHCEHLHEHVWFVRFQKGRQRERDGQAAPPVCPQVVRDDAWVPQG